LASINDMPFTMNYATSLFSFQFMPLRTFLSLNALNHPNTFILMCISEIKYILKNMFRQIMCSSSGRN